MQVLDDETRAKLIADVDFALRLKARLPSRWADEAASKRAAAAIVDQVLLSNWRIERGPPLPLHGNPTRAAENGNASTCDKLIAAIR